MNAIVGRSPTRWLWTAVGVIRPATRARITGWTLSAGTGKSPVVKAVPSGFAWKLIGEVRAKAGTVAPSGRVTGWATSEKDSLATEPVARPRCANPRNTRAVSM